MCTVIDNNAFFHWMIVVRSGQVFKYSYIRYLNTSEFAYLNSI